MRTDTFRSPGEISECRGESLKSNKFALVFACIATARMCDNEIAG